jgi:hypothetical protein
MKQQIVMLFTFEPKKAAVEVFLTEDGILRDFAADQVICESDEPGALEKKLLEYVSNNLRKEVATK